VTQAEIEGSLLGRATRVASVFAKYGLRETRGSGDALDVPATRPVSPVPPPDALVDAAARLGVRGRVEVGRALAAIGEPERNAARRLGVTPERLVLAAVGRWGKPFSAERDARIARRRATTEPDHHITLRGLVTREMLAELQDHLAVR